MHQDFLEITCPGCQSVLIVRRRDGKVVETRKPIVEDSSGDRFEDAFQKVKRSKHEIQKKYEEARQREQGKMDRLNSLFKENLDRAREEGPAERPEREMDLD